MADKSNIESRLAKAEELKSSLEAKYEKVKGARREQEFISQLDKVTDLIDHLKKELEW